LLHLFLIGFFFFPLPSNDVSHLALFLVLHILIRPFLFLALISHQIRVNSTYSCKISANTDDKHIDTCGISYRNTHPTLQIFKHCPRTCDCGLLAVVVAQEL